jgi:hypothetical protein
MKDTGIVRFGYIDRPPAHARGSNRSRDRERVIKLKHAVKIQEE